MGPLIRSGYDFRRVVQILSGGSPMVLTGATGAVVALKDLGKATELIADTAVSLVATGTDLATGRLVVQFSAAQTAGLLPELAWIEIAILIDGLRLPVYDLAVVIERGFATT